MMWMFIPFRVNRWLELVDLLPVTSRRSLALSQTLSHLYNIFHGVYICSWPHMRRRYDENCKKLKINEEREKDENVIAACRCCTCQGGRKEEKIRQAEHTLDLLKQLASVLGEMRKDPNCSLTENLLPT
ncbi:hypothetical protein Nepgr_009048 [Nepenthes gracilis]|uniref:Uncharacterized protein n=1 Tax=Nepenthes gracilis TaxID=150966 RepID=A0AAD3SA08_NEPGR|nr:hypothetical protein Nepgr_009048 [Nepenthes gracilis]